MSGYKTLFLLDVVVADVAVAVFGVNVVAAAVVATALIVVAAMGVVAAALHGWDIPDVAAVMFATFGMTAIVDGGGRLKVMLLLFCCYC